MGSAITVGHRRGAGTSRRAFLGVSALAGLAAGYFSAPLVEYLGSASDAPWRTLSAGEAAILDGLLEELLPGAREARVVRFIDWQLASDAPFANKADLYHAHLAHLRGRSARDVEQNYPEFFRLVLMHAKLGYYGNPRYGGNAQGRGYRDLGVESLACPAGIASR